MPSFEYTGPGGPRTYPETRDAHGVGLGTVQPGDVREFPEAPDQYWAPYEGGGEAAAGGGGESVEPPAAAAPPAAPPTAP